MKILHIPWWGETIPKNRQKGKDNLPVLFGNQVSCGQLVTQVIWKCRQLRDLCHIYGACLDKAERFIPA